MMSVDGVNWAFKQNVPPTQKLVLIALGHTHNKDNAPDELRCWPSVGTIAEKTGLTSRSIFNALAWLEKNGLLKVDRKHGHRSTYTLKRGEGDSPLTPERDSPHYGGENDSPLKEIHTTPERDSPQPLKEIHTTPERDSPKRELKGKKKKGSKGNKNIGAISYPDWLNLALWVEFKTHRQKLKKPMTEYAEQQNIAKLQALMKSENETQEEIINRSIMRGWQGFFPDSNNKQNFSKTNPSKKPAPDNFASVEYEGTPMEEIEWMNQQN